MPAKKAAARLEDAPVFAPKDFLAFERHKLADPDYNAERLLLKRKLHAMGEPLVAHLNGKGADLVLRTSIHNPFTFNGYRVDSLWLYLAPSDKAKKPLRDLLGVDFASDTDASYVHANFVVEIDAHGVNLGLRVHERAWWDVHNAKAKCATREGAEQLARLLSAVPASYALRMHDWQGGPRCGAVKWDQVNETFRHCEPGRHRLSVWRSLKKDDPALADKAFLAGVAEEFASLLPVYDFLLWSPENNHVLGRR